MVVLYMNPTYKLQVQIGITSNQPHPHICLLNIGAGPNIVSDTVLAKEWSRMIENQSVPEVRSAIK